MSRTRFPAWRRIAAVWVYVPIYLACVLGAGLLWPRPKLLLLAYFCIACALLWRWHDKADLLYFFVPFVLGPLGEWLAVSLGAWRYSEAPLSLPLWLPFAWGIAFLFIKKTTDALLGVTPESTHS